MDYLVARELNGLYIWLDCLFLLMMGYLLFRMKKHSALWFGIAGAVIYFIVDYGIFYLWLGTRIVVGANPFWFLLWLSTSYGFTNFVWIWLFLDREKKIVEWSSLIVIGWFSIAMIAQTFGGTFATVQIQRGTGGYHGFMALMLFVGYGYAIVRNLSSPKTKRIPIEKLLFVGILVQFSWEAVLLISGIRPQGIQPLIVNSLLETNLGLPYLYFIHRAIKHREQTVENTTPQEDLKRIGAQQA